MKSKKTATKRTPPAGAHLYLAPETYAKVQLQARHFGFKGEPGEEKALACMISELVMIRSHLRGGELMIPKTLAAVIAAADPLNSKRL